MAPVVVKYQTIADRDNDDIANNNIGNDVLVDGPAHSAEQLPPPHESAPPPPTSMMEVIILDFTHTRFTVPLAAGLTGTVADLKAAGARHHAVPANQQRLIYQGKLLSDETATMQQCGIRHGSIVHLFPKPRVVVVANNNNNSNTTNGQQPASNDAGGGGEPDNTTATGRVPTILVDEAEHARRGQILVLGSVDYMEAVNNVKLFSFMLLIVSTIELLNLVAVALGEGSDPSSSNSSSGMMMNNEARMPYLEHDDFFPSDDDATGTTSPNDINLGGFGNGTASPGAHNETTAADFANPYQTWTALSWIDLVVSVLGIYVALLGIRASNDNVLSLARLYLLGTVLTAVGWLVYNFIINFEIDEMQREQLQEQLQEQQQEQGNSNSNLDPRYAPLAPLNTGGAGGDSVFNQAVQAMVLPAVVWGLCIFRAWQFQHLLAEAELEALERIQAEQEAEEEGAESQDEEQPAPQYNRQPAASSSSSSSPAPVVLPAIS